MLLQRTQLRAMDKKFWEKRLHRSAGIGHLRLQRPGNINIVDEK